MQIAGVILAGGTGLRMGGVDKAFVTLGGHALIQRVRARFEPQVDMLAISANGPAARFADLGLPVLADDLSVGSRGPLSGILAALNWANRMGATHLVSVAVDCPFFPLDLVPRLCLAGEKNEGGLAIAHGAGRDHPTFGLWPVVLTDALRDYLAGQTSARVMGFVDMHHAMRAEFADRHAFTNLNTPEDLAAAEVWLAGRS